MSFGTAKALAQKDRPWRLALGLLGYVGLVIAVLEHHFLYGFVVGPGQRDALFHVSWSAGIALGIVASCFDEMLGTTELLRQRPLSASAVYRARVGGCARVLAAWLLFVPIGAQFAAMMVDSTFEWGHWRQVPEIWATMTPALSGCAIGLAAGALPFPWWARLVCLAPLFLVPFTAIWWLTSGEPEVGVGFVADPGRLAACHLAVAIAAGALARAASTATRDADHPLAPRVRLRVVAPVVALAVLLATLVLGEVEANAVRFLRGIYPRALVHQQEVVLAARGGWDQPWQRVDAQHRRTGVVLAGATTWLMHEERRRVSGGLRLDAPRNGRPAQSAGFGSRGSLVLGGDGVAWFRSIDGRIRRIPKQPHVPRFAPGTSVEHVSGAGAFVCVEPGRDVVWTLQDGETAVGFTAVPMPDGDRVRGFERAGTSRVVRAAAAGGDVALALDEHLVAGRDRVYAVRDGALRAVGTIGPRDSDRQQQWKARIEADDRLGYTLVFDGEAGVPPFRHEFRPRTAVESMFAAMACALSALRPPPLQLAALVRKPPAAGGELPYTVERWPWLFDPLVVDGRRWWLTLLSFAVAAGTAWLVRWRLRRIGGDRAAIRFWTIAALLLGPFAGLASELCERPRAWARRELAVPPPAPRIVSPLPEDLPAEVPA